MAHERSPEDAPEVLREGAALGNAHAVGMAFIGEALAWWLALVATGLIAALAYLGPRGSEVLFIRRFAAKVDRQG
nr:hypothetical protein [Sinorhizobium meliloti]